MGDRLIAFEKIWRVEGFEGTTVRLEGIGDGTTRSVSVHEVVADPSFRVLGGDEADETGGALASAGALGVTSEVWASADALARHIAEVEGRGQFLPDERPPRGYVPRAAYRPDRPRTARYKAKVAELAGTSLACSYRQLERYVAAYRRDGVSGLLRHGALVKQVRRRRADVRYLDVLASQMLAEAAGPERGVDVILMATNKVIESNPEYADVVVPSVSTQKRWLKDLMEREGWRYGRRKYVQSRQQRPDRTHHHVAALMPGERVEVDTTVLNVLVLDPATGREFRPFLTVALDVATRCVAGLVASHSENHTTMPRLMLDVTSPKPATPVGSAHSYVNRLGVAPHVLFEVFPDLPDDARFADGPLILPRTVVMDQGKAFSNRQVHEMLKRLKVAVEPARPRTPTDKPHVERFFRTLESALVLLVGYVGKDVASRGHGRGGENAAVLTLAELETVLRAWIALEYHQRRHRGLRLPVSRGDQVELSPMEAYALLIEQHGFIPAPLTPELRLLLMDVSRLTIQDDGISLAGLVYDSPELDHVRRSQCPWRPDGKWRVHYDPMDCRRVHVEVPTDGVRRWIEVPWRHQPSELKFPFPFRVLDFVRQYEPGDRAPGALRSWKEREKKELPRLSTSEVAAEGAMDFAHWVRLNVLTGGPMAAGESSAVIGVLRDFADSLTGTYLEKLEARYVRKADRPVERPAAAVVDGHAPASSLLEGHGASSPAPDGRVLTVRERMLGMTAPAPAGEPE